MELRESIRVKDAEAATFIYEIEVLKIFLIFSFGT